MGLLDSLFDPNTYGGQGRGLLDFLRNSQASPLDSAQWPYGPNGTPSTAPASFADRFNALPKAPAAFAPSGRTFDNAQFDPSTYAPNQAQPIAIGNYQMPRIGSADLYNAPPSSAALPPNAQPTQGQLPTAQAHSTDISAQSREPQQPLPPAFGGGGYMDRLNNGGGLISSLFGDSGQQKNLTAQYQSLRAALRQNGETEQAANSKAMLAVMNPDAAKTVIPELLTNKAEWGVISDDPLEGKKYGWIDKNNRTINGKEAGAAGSSPTGGGLAGIQAAQNAGVTGDALYENLPVAMRGTVKAMIEGRQPLPSTTAMRSPATLALIDAAHAIDPTFDATVWKSRNEAGPDWSKGKSSEMVRSANQTLAHVGSLMDAMDKLKNTSFPAANWVGNNVREQLGAGEQGSFRTNAHAVAEEMSKVFKGANLSDSEIRHWEQNLSENMSPTQQRAQVAKLSELLHGSLQALEEKRLSAMGPAQAAKMGPLIKEEGQRVLSRIDDWVKGNSAQSQAPNLDMSSVEAEMRRRGLLK